MSHNKLFLCQLSFNKASYWTIDPFLNRFCNYGMIHIHILLNINYSIGFILCYYTFFGCKYVDRSQWDYFTKGLWVIFSLFLLFHMKEFLNEIFCNLLLKIHIVFPIDNMFCVNHCWIKMNSSKCVNFARFCICHLENLS